MRAARMPQRSFIVVSGWVVCPWATRGFHRNDQHDAPRMHLEYDSVVCFEAFSLRRIARSMRVCQERALTAPPLAPIASTAGVLRPCWSKTALYGDCPRGSVMGLKFGGEEGAEGSRR